jgi:hypothetical protein
VYYVDVKDSNGCKGQSADTMISSLAVNQLVINGIAVTVIPNPATSFIQLTAGVALQVAIYNSLGQMVIQRTVQPAERVNVGTLPSGIYIVRESTSGKSIGKFVKY